MSVVRLLAAAGLGGALLLPATSAHGQVPDSAPAAPTPPATGGWAAYAAVPRPWSTVVAITAVLPAGSAGDAEGLDGTAWLLGHTSAEVLRSRLGEGTVRVEVEVDRNRTVYRVLTVPDLWARAYRTLEEVLFDDPDAALAGLDPVRASLLSAHVFEAGAPVREFEREVYRMLTGAGSPWSRDPRGDPATLERITSDDLAAFRRRRYNRGEAVLTLTGAVDPGEAQRLVAGEDPGRYEAEEAHVAVRAAPSSPRSPAWTVGDRIHQVRDVTSGWIAAAYPLDPATPRTAAEMLADRVQSELVTEPPAPGLFSADVTLEGLPGGHTALLVRAAVLPGSVDAWETRIEETMAHIAGEPLGPGFFRFHRRQFRNRRLVEDAGPEDEGLRTALDLRRTGAPRDLAAEVWGLGTETVHQAAQTLGPARILVYAPDLGR